MKPYKLLCLAAWLLTGIPAAAREQADAPRKNYMMVHVGLFPNTYYSDQYRSFGPLFGFTYGRQFNTFLAVEGNIFVGPASAKNQPDENLPDGKYLNLCRYGVNAGLIVTPLGNLFRYARAGITAGYSREDIRCEYVSDQKRYHTESYNSFNIGVPLRLYALDSKKFALCAEANLQYANSGSTEWTLRTVNYTVNFAYKF